MKKIAATLALMTKVGGGVLTQNRDNIHATLDRELDKYQYRRATMRYRIAQIGFEIAWWALPGGSRAEGDDPRIYAEYGRNMATHVQENRNA